MIQKNQNIHDFRQPQQQDSYGQTQQNDHRKSRT